MRTIHKYILDIVGEQIFTQIPEGAKILCCQMQHGVPCIWAEVDTDREPRNRRFRIFGTGNPMPDTFVGKYIGTVQQDRGFLIWHIYEQVV